MRVEEDEYWSGWFLAAAIFRTRDTESGTDFADDFDGETFGPEDTDFSPIPVRPLDNPPHRRGRIAIPIPKDSSTH